MMNWEISGAGLVMMLRSSWFSWFLKDYLVERRRYNFYWHFYEVMIDYNYLVGKDKKSSMIWIDNPGIPN